VFVYLAIILVAGVVPDTLAALEVEVVHLARDPVLAVVGEERGMMKRKRKSKEEEEKEEEEKSKRKSKSKRKRRTRRKSKRKRKTTGRGRGSGLTMLR
jgi:hypothetical protein